MVAIRGLAMMNKDTPSRYRLLERIGAGGTVEVWTQLSQASGGRRLRARARGRALGVEPLRDSPYEQESPGGSGRALAPVTLASATGTQLLSFQVSRQPLDQPVATYYFF